MPSTVTAISVDQFLSTHDTEIFASEISDRIKQLEEEISEAQQSGDDRDTIEELSWEYDELVAFRDEVERRTGNHFDEATIVPEDLFAEHARGRAEEIADIDFLSEFVDWDRFANHLKGDYQQVNFGDDAVYIK